MGNFCKSRAIKRDAEYYFKQVNENQLDVDNAKEKTQLVISLSQCCNLFIYSVNLLTYSTANRAVGNLGGTTESKTASQLQIKFDKFFIMEYYFEKEQPIGFEVCINNSKSLVKTTLGKIMGSRGQVFNSTLPSGETISVQGKSLMNSSYVAYFDISIMGALNNNDYYFVIKDMGTQNRPSNNLLYKSEAKIGMNALEFNQLSIQTHYLGNGDLQNNYIAIEIHDFYSQEILGEHVSVINELIAKSAEIELKEPNLKRKAIIKCKLIKQYTFLDYLRGGMQIALTIGIDFTKSNRDPFDPQSLHNISSNQMNAYECAIKSCGTIVGFYDYDQLFPVYGYGAIVPGQNAVNHCFPINGGPDPNINTINGVLECYRRVLPTLRFYGPTYFAPIINALNDTVKADLARGNAMIYNILMILTDGQINDLDATIDALVEASFLPISVIIIGIGIGDFGNMDILDADVNPLYDRNNRKAARDLVQFVPFYKFQSDGQKLAEEVLEEVPRQVIDYYQQNNLLPGDPIVQLQGNYNY